jgi:selenocysteine lyase/cysteine desulfurase
MDVSHEFPLEPGLIYLNHAAVSPWPARTAAAIIKFAEENRDSGARHYPRWVKVETRLRERLQRLIGARGSDEIALLKSTSEGLSVIAHGLDWKPGDKVVIPRQEFPSNRIAWESLARYGVQVQMIDLYAQDDPEAALMAALDERTRLLSVSSVQFDTGLRLDLARLGRACEAAEVLFCVDAIQSLGALPLNAREIRADFVVADGHKWLLGPEGLALFYCRRELRERLNLHQYGWLMVEHMGDFDRSHWRPAASGRRFECGSPNMLGVHGLEASLSLIEDVGLESIALNVLKNASYLIDYIESVPDKYTLVTARNEARHAGIVSFRPVREEVLGTASASPGPRCGLCGAQWRGAPVTPLLHAARPARSDPGYVMSVDVVTGAAHL